MADVILSSDQITVLGGPSSISVDVDLGTPGKRGSIILASPGIPSGDSVGGVPVQVYDIAVNVAPGNEYLAFYQYLISDGVPGWRYVLQLSNNVYSKNAIYEFDNGSVNVSIPFSEIVAYGIIPNIAESNFNIQLNFVNASPIASSINNLQIVRDDQNNALSLDFTIVAAEFNTGTNSFANLDGARPVYMFVSVI